MARIASGDGAAFGRLVDRHVDRALRLAQRMLGSRADAEDAVQEVFLKIWRKAETWRSGRAAFTTWLWRIVVNQCLDARRRPGAVSLDSVAEPIDEAPDQEAAMAAAQEDARVAAAVATLPERQQAALALIYGAGASNAEAAESLGLSVGAVEQLLVRARRSLRVQLVEATE
ncbi:MAG: sigma-70 family RNA polymerase sigma factor [Alphaproteobacteria bacterium]